MTDEEKLIIKKELYKAYEQLSSLSLYKRYVGAIMIGLNNAQKILNKGDDNVDK